MFVYAQRILFCNFALILPYLLLFCTLRAQTQWLIRLDDRNELCAVRFALYFTYIAVVIAHILQNNKEEHIHTHIAY